MVLVYFNGFCGELLMTVVGVVVVLFWVFFSCHGLWLPQWWWWWWLMVIVLGFLRWVVAVMVVLVVVLVCGFLVVQFGFDGFCLP